MTLNRDQAKYANDELYNDAVQSEIKAVLCQDGPMYCGQVAQKVGKSAYETRWHLTQMKNRAEIGFNWATQRYNA